MAGKHISASASSSSNRLISIVSRSPIFLLFAFSLLTLSLLLFLFFSSSSSTFASHRSFHSTKPVETSFVSSLEHFLHSSRSRPSNGDDTVRIVRDDDVAKLDDLTWRTDTERLYGGGEGFSKLRIYVYEMPSKFTYDLLRLFRDSYRETSNLTSNGSPIHRLIEQHSIDYWLWADLIAPESERILKNVVRVHRQKEADLFYIPFFTTISFFLLEKQQYKSLYRV